MPNPQQFDRARIVTSTAITIPGLFWRWYFHLPMEQITGPEMSDQTQEIAQTMKDLGKTIDNFEEETRAALKIDTEAKQYDRLLAVARTAIDVPDKFWNWYYRVPTEAIKGPESVKAMWEIVRAIEWLEDALDKWLERDP